ncbi:MAG: hypothetical protein AAFX06_20230 [Planctomycetota bacterium]
MQRVEPQFQYAKLLSVELFAVVLAFFGSMAWGQESSSDSTDSSTIHVQIDIGEFVTSEIGEMLTQAGAGLMGEELGKDPDEAIAAVEKSLGFDPATQKLRAVLSIKDIENPLETMTVQAEFKDSTGNLEGLLLAAPEYESFKHGEHTIHSFSLDGQDAFVGFLTSRSGKKRVVMSVTKDDVANALDEGAKGDLGWSIPEGQFVSVKLNSLPEEVNEVPPLATLSSLLDHIGLSIGEEDENLTLKLAFHATEEEKAMQLQQLAQGAVAMVSLFSEQIREELDDEETATNVLNAVERIVVQRADTTVEMELSIPMSIVIQFLREEADLPL